jgi:thiamine-phosphate pyrophosphorylase
LRVIKVKPIDRIIDANINRVKEGLRVCEEVTRFLLESRTLTEDFKKIRHKIDRLLKNFLNNLNLLKERDSLGDVGRSIYFKKEFARYNYQDIFFANIQRVKESLRVLEEFLKLKNTKLSSKLKQLRYDIYEIEKKVAGKLSALRHYR